MCNRFSKNLGLGDGSGRLINCQVFKSSGDNHTPTKGTRFIIVEIVGWGAGGGYIVQVSVFRKMLLYQWGFPIPFNQPMVSVSVM
ncbi:hypothetical protein [Escherichia coli]|uniref:hypothetical protein n=1 Tax=Escherichia coli TaxID=562 RepID=UPI00388ED8F9